MNVGVSRDIVRANADHRSVVETGARTGQSVRLEHVSKDLASNGDQFGVLEDLSFEVTENEFVVILGPSGCGKTTLLKLVAGIVAPSSGTVSIGDEPVNGPSPNIAMVFQEFVLLPWKTVIENVVLGLEIQGSMDTAECRDIATTWIETVGLAGFEHSYPTELSGGMKQRVGLARALAVDPAVLLMDEPFGSLDAQTKVRMQTELLELWDAQKTILFVTHDIDEAIFLADRILVLSPKPATITDRVSVQLDRPRWDRRASVEESEEFSRLKQRLRRDVGLLVG